MRVGDLVMTCDPGSLSNSWEMGRISDTFPGSNGRVRVVEVSCGQMKFRRPATSVAVVLEDASTTSSGGGCLGSCPTEGGLPEDDDESPPTPGN